ncbi:hypothetical protein NESM_000627000 [Novymonas esmeraldas]|uniref:Uncharacterized protein n=1 Tax=Novymonas esmeraldas TaxID=1808958 RepID=A0AAW0EV58_9TRYP
MFKGCMNTDVGRRATRRLATVAGSAQRSGRRSSRETVRHCTEQLERQQRRRGPRATAGASQFQLESWTAAQADALAQEAANWRAADPLRRAEHAVDDERVSRAGRGGPTTSSSYSHVNADTGNSAAQERFDALVHTALLRYGPPLPVDVVAAQKVDLAASPAGPSPSRSPQHRHTHHDGGADDPTAVYYDEVALRLHELLTILRREQPHFSVRDDCDGLPLSLLVKNSPYLRAFGGKVNYMRFLRRLRPTAAAPSRDAPTPSVAVLSLGKYKMREPSSQDGLRQGPQPWLYSYSMIETPRSRPPRTA